MHFTQYIPIPRIAAIGAITLYADQHNLERNGREDFDIVLEVLHSCIKLRKVRLLIYDYLGDLCDEHSHWFTQDLVASKKLQKGLWVEHVTSSYGVDESDEWEDVDSQDSGGSANDGSSTKREKSERGKPEEDEPEKKVLKRHFHYNMFKKYRVRSDGKRADYWDNWDGGDNSEISD